MVRMKLLVAQMASIFMLLIKSGADATSLADSPIDPPQPILGNFLVALTPKRHLKSLDYVSRTHLKTQIMIVPKFVLTKPSPGREQFPNCCLQNLARVANSSQMFAYKT